MYGEGNAANLAKEITNNGSQVIDSLNKTLGVDIKSLLAGVLGTKLVDGIRKNNKEIIKDDDDPKIERPKKSEEKEDTIKDDKK